MRSILPIVLMSVVSFGSLASAQTEPSGIEGTGTAQVDRLPEKMRLQITILSKAATAKGAVVGLKHRVENARKKVVALGAKESSIKVEPISVEASMQDRLRMLNVLQLRNGVQADPKPAQPMPVLVSCVLMADLPLSSKTQDALVVEVKELQDSIEAAKLSGKDAAKELTPAEKEIQNLDGNGNVAIGGVTGATTEPGDPTYAFIIRVSDEEHTKALAEAFRNAQADATEFAKATGVELGPVKAITKTIERGQPASTNTTPGVIDWDVVSLSNAVARPALVSTDLREAVSATSHPVKYSVTVKIGYDLKRTGK